MNPGIELAMWCWANVPAVEPAELNFDRRIKQADALMAWVEGKSTGPSYPPRQLHESTATT